jgi:acetyltransferase
MLDALFNPSAIAVVGASNDTKKVGHAVLDSLIRYQFRGSILPVNPAGGEILGLRAFKKASEAGTAVDLAVIAIPPHLVPEALADCGRAGAKAAVIVTAGFREAGPKGLALEQEITAIGKEQGIRILGPNCLGAINTANSMNASFAGGMLPKGRIAFFSQSGALGVAILDWAAGNEIGFSKFVSLGNKADLNEVDFIEYFIDDPETDIILGYIEDVVDGRRFLETAARATKKKPIVLLKSGGTAAGARAASSHTGALAGSDIAFNAAFRQTGVIRAQGIQDLFDTALAFVERKVPKGNRLLIVTNAGGPGIIAADAAEKLGVRLPQLTKETVDALRPLLPSNASLYNPVDIIGDALSERYAAAIGTASQDPNVDGVLAVLTPQAVTDVENTADVIIAAAAKTERPVLASFIGEARVRASVKRLKEHSIPNFPYPELAVKAFKRLADYRAWRDAPPPPDGVCRFDSGPVREAVDRLLASGIDRVGEDEAMALLGHYGFPFPKRKLATTSREAAVIASKIGFPVVMKISSPDILHKTDVGGVRLGVRSAGEAEDAFREITANAKRVMPDAFIRGVMIYEMVTGGKEVILGVTTDRTFGHMIMFGLGGIYVEVLKDVSFRIAPVTKTDAMAMISEIKTSALLRGARGERPVDVEAVADTIVRLSCLVRDVPEIQELDINPLKVMEKGAVALDGRIIFKTVKG